MNIKTVLNKFLTKAMALSRSKGFTLIELLVVIAVLGVLAAAVVAAINPVQKIDSAKNANIKSDISQIANALQAYYTARSTPSYPAALIDLTPNELKTVPTPPGGGSYEYTITPAACTTAGNTCTNIALSEPIAGSTTDVWCWRSSTGIASQVATASCTAP